jgi:hypothetical protein
VRNPKRVRAVVLTAMSPPTKWARRMLGSTEDGRKSLDQIGPNTPPAKSSRRLRRRTSAEPLS